MNSKIVITKHDKKIPITQPGAQLLQTLVVTTASDTDPGSQTTFLHWEVIANRNKLPRTEEECLNVKLKPKTKIPV